MNLGCVLGTPLIFQEEKAGKLSYIHVIKASPVQLRPFLGKVMEEDFLRDYPELRPFVLSDVELTGIKIGEGAYGQVDEVAFPVGAAAKTIHAILQGELTKAAAEFVRECQLMSTVCHPNVVQFLGVAFFSGSRLPALVMERLLTSPRS